MQFDPVVMVFSLIVLGVMAYTARICTRAYLKYGEQGGGLNLAVAMWLLTAQRVVVFIIDLDIAPEDKGALKVISLVLVLATTITFFLGIRTLENNLDRFFASSKDAEKRAMRIDSKNSPCEIAPKARGGKKKKAR